MSTLKPQNLRSMEQRLGPVFTAVALAIVVLLSTTTAHAFPDPIVESIYARSQPWLTFTTGGAGTVRFDLTLSSNCTDPVPSRALFSSTYCGGSPSAVDVFVHVFRDDVGEVGDPIPCKSNPGSTTANCTVSISVPATAWYGLLIHGGPGARGNTTGTISVTQTAPSIVTYIDNVAVSLAGNIAQNIGDGPRDYDIVSVLVADGVGANNTSDTGNVANDFLGTDSTEVWILGSNGRALRADLQHSGVGAAGRISAVGAGEGAMAVVRPWSPPPTAFRVRTTGILQPTGHARSLWRDSAGVPIVGNGRMRVVFNDRYGNDADGDGLSNRVEEAVHTCTGIQAYTSDDPSAPATACTLFSALNDANRRTMATMDPRDTDGDGLSDGVEVLGTDISEGPINLASGACFVGSPATLYDADQTFPLWGFSPRHKDMLLEVDRTAELDHLTVGSPTIQTCMSPTHGVAMNRIAWPPVATTDSRSLGLTMTLGIELGRLEQHYSSLLAERVANPDGTRGIRLHVDLRLPISTSTAHGNIPAFWFNDGTRLRTDVVMYIPGIETDGSWRIGSSAGCRTNVCPSLRHGGYSHYSRISDRLLVGGGGDSSCNTEIRSAGFDANSIAHEAGHHLGLGHEGPFSTCAGLPNPFAPSAPDGANGKLNQISLMNYRLTSYSRLPEDESFRGCSFGLEPITPIVGP
jgi:hypothetical protein